MEKSMFTSQVDFLSYSENKQYQIIQTHECQVRYYWLYGPTDDAC